MVAKFSFPKLDFVTDKYFCLYVRVRCRNKKNPFASMYLYLSKSSFGKLNLATKHLYLVTFWRDVL